MSDRDQLRQFFFSAWQKHLNKQPVEPLEAQIIDVIVVHPEFHDFFTHGEPIEGEINPFLHLSLHLSVRDQIATNRPLGIQSIYQHLIQKFSDPLIAEHKIMECLEQILWEAQEKGNLPSEEIYLDKLKGL